MCMIFMYGPWILFVLFLSLSYALHVLILTHLVSAGRVRNQIVYNKPPLSSTRSVLGGDTCTFKASFHIASASTLYLTMPPYLYPLPTTSLITFSAILTDPSSSYTTILSEATAARTKLHLTLKGIADNEPGASALAVLDVRASSQRYI